MFRRIIFSLLGLAFLTTMATTVTAQTITTPRASQQATITQRVGITDISITYHSPAVRGRKVWGALVPFDQVWRAGANENTVISFTHPVSIEGHELAAGSYGLYMTPHEETVDIIFSSSTKNWGTVIPTPEETVMTVSVNQKTGPHQEWLSFDFLDRGGNEVTAALKWETWIIPFKVKVDVQNIVLDNMRDELKGVAGFGYLGHEQVARYCLLNNLALEDALVWIDRSINAERRFSNLSVKAGLLKKAGKTNESEAMMDEALALATPVQMNIYGYQLMNGGDVEGAIDIFLENIEKTPKTHPFYWGFIDSVGEGYLRNNDKKNAIKYYTLAKTYAPQNRQGYLDGVIQGIKEKK
jgi:hypothetical protein